MTRSTASYFIEFTNPSGDMIEWVHIAEVRFSDQPTTIATTATPLAVGLAVIVVDLLLLLAVCGMLYLVCVLRAKVSTTEGREEENNTMQHGEVIGTGRNEAYCHVGGEREGRIAESRQNEGADSEYDTIEEREVIGTERNEAYSHFDRERREEHLTEEGSTGSDVVHEEM